VRTAVVASLREIARDDWNALLPDDNPFVRYEFLAALEDGDCLRPYGWIPRHAVVYDGSRLVAAMPMYIKDNSYGEFVFDFAWAQAYRRYGREYYPKLVVSVPYSPATGPRLLVANPDHMPALIDSAREFALEHRLSSLHVLFTSDEQTRQLESLGLQRRAGCQFHWTNPGYRDFDDYLATFTAEKRKKLKRERRHVQEANVELDVVHGDEASDSQWSRLHHFYASTFERLGGYATLSEAFFRQLGATMGRQVVLVFARHANREVAAAFCLQGANTLYGRHWGCDAQFNSLHFEACYYQGIDYCIRNGLRRFEPGAQGEHKVGRGFVPTLTWSAHWLENADFSRAIAEFLPRERRALDSYMDELATHLPYRKKV
jgi:hypothetical protein